MQVVQDSPFEALGNKLNIIEDLRDKLVHVKWNHESLRFLDRIVRDTLTLARENDNLRECLERATKLHDHVTLCLESECLPHGSERERLIEFLDDLIQVRSGAENPGKEFRELEREVSPGEELVVVGGAELMELSVKLESMGFRVRRVESRRETRLALIRAAPAAVIIDADRGEQSLAGIAMIAHLRERFGLLKAPVFFLSERSDLAARMEAVAAGGTGYFVKPVNVTALVESLNDRLLYESMRGYRVLIVNDDSSQAFKMAGVLEAKGIITKVITQPSQTFQAVYRFRPNLMLLDLELKELNGVELAKTIRQHEACEGLPLVLLASEGSLSQHLAALGAEGGDLLSKPLPPDYLLTAVTYRLRRARSLYRKLSNLTYRDAVTGLYNRRYFLDYLERQLALPREEIKVSVILITLDNLRALETVDVREADEVMEQAARRLNTLLDGSRKAARFGAATFAVAVSSDDRETLPSIARAVQAMLCEQPYQTGDNSVLLQTSTGISISAGDAWDYLTLIQQAEIACSIAREVGPNRFHIFDSTADQGWEMAYQKRMLEQIHDAIDHLRLGLVFQPIVSLRGKQSERYEVFLRMYNAQGQEMLPEAVFSVAQSHRLGQVLDRWVIAHTIRLLQERQGSQRPTTLFINVSPAVLQDDKAVDWLEEGLRKTGVYSKDLVFEVSKATIDQEPEKWRQFAKSIRGLGCGFSLDRFTLQQDSVGIFRQLPVDYVKLNGRCIEDLSNDQSKQNALRALINDLSSLKIDTIVSGIEDWPTLQALWSCGIDHVQGFFLQRPHEHMDYVFTKDAL